jgi:hypothetical protein
VNEGFVIFLDPSKQMLGYCLKLATTAFCRISPLIVPCTLYIRNSENFDKPTVTVNDLHNTYKEGKAIPVTGREGP